MEIQANTAEQLPDATPQGWSKRFIMPLFQRGTQVRHAGRWETVDYVHLRRLEMAVFLVGHAEPFSTRQLELALGVRFQFTCGGQQIGTLAELTARLQAGASDLDACVQELVQADGFAAWMAGQGLEAVLPRARAWAAVMEENEAAARRGEPV